MLYTEVCRVAHALSSLRIRKGDHVALYMPMIPELFFHAGLRRIGAIHTAIFSGYAEGGVHQPYSGLQGTRCHHSRCGRARWQIQTAQRQS